MCVSQSTPTKTKAIEQASHIKLTKRLIKKIKMLTIRLLENC